MNECRWGTCRNPGEDTVCSHLLSDLAGPFCSQLPDLSTMEVDEAPPRTLQLSCSCMQLRPLDHVLMQAKYKGLSPSLAIIYSLYGRSFPLSSHAPHWPR